MTAELLIAGLIAALVGLAAGWLLRGREVAALAGKLTSAEAMRNEAIRDLAVASERAAQADALRDKLDATSEARDAAHRELAALRAEAAARAESYEERIKTINEAREALNLQFRDTANKLLEEAGRKLSERSGEQFKQNEVSLKALLQPVETTLKRYEDGLKHVEKDRVDSYAALREAVEQVRSGQGQVREEAARLVNALQANSKTRGRWGEQSLYNVLEQAGLTEGIDYRKEVSVETDEGRLRPDVIVSLPGGRELIIDAKCSLSAYLEASQVDDKEARSAHLLSHAQSMRRHAEQLSTKEYWSRFGQAADYVIMYIPGDHFLSAALDQDGEIWERAHSKKVLLATPTTLVAIARTVASVWRQEKLAREAQQVGALGKEMYERLFKAAEWLGKLGKSLNTSVSHYNSFLSTFETRVLVTGRRFKELNVDTGGKEIEDLQSVEALARLPDPVAGNDEDAQAAE